MDAAGTIVDMNAAAERMFNRGRGDAKGQSLAALFIPEEFHADHQRAIDALRADGDATVGQRLDIEGLRSGGGRFPIELSVSRIDAPAGVMYVNWIRDSSDRRAAEDALRHSEMQLRQAQKMEA